VVPSPVTTFTIPGGKSASAQTSANASAVSGDKQRKIKRHDRADHAERPRAIRAVDRPREFVGPSGVIEKVRRRLRNIEVARFANRFSAVERLEHRKLARTLAQHACDAIDVLRSFRRSQLAPIFLVAAARGTHRAIHVGGRCRRNVRERLLGRGIYGRERAPIGRSDPFATDEKSVTLAQRDGRRRLERGSVTEVERGRRHAEAT
jgi:hypothetical protein